VTLVSYRVSTSIMRHRVKFCRPGELPSEICAPLPYLLNIPRTNKLISFKIDGSQFCSW